MVHSEGNAGPVSCDNAGCVREFWKRPCRFNDSSSVRTREKNSSDELGGMDGLQDGGHSRFLFLCCLELATL